MMKIWIIIAAIQEWWSGLPGELRRCTLLEVLFRSRLPLCQASYRENVLLEWTRWCLQYFLILWLSKFGLITMALLADSSQNEISVQTEDWRPPLLTWPSGTARVANSETLPLPMAKHFWNRLTGSFFCETPFCWQPTSDRQIMVIRIWELADMIWNWTMGICHFRKAMNNIFCQ